MEQETVEVEEQIIHGQDRKPQYLSLTKEWNEEREHRKHRRVRSGEPGPTPFIAPPPPLRAARGQEQRSAGTGGENTRLPGASSSVRPVRVEHRSSPHRTHRTEPGGRGRSVHTPAPVRADTEPHTELYSPGATHRRAPCRHGQRYQTGIFPQNLTGRTTERSRGQRCAVVPAGAFRGLGPGPHAAALAARAGPQTSPDSTQLAPPPPTPCRRPRLPGPDSGLEQPPERPCCPPVVRSCPLAVSAAPPPPVVRSCPLAVSAAPWRSVLHPGGPELPPGASGASASPRAPVPAEGPAQAGCRDGRKDRPLRARDKEAQERGGFRSEGARMHQLWRPLADQAGGSGPSGRSSHVDSVPSGFHLSGWPGRRVAAADDVGGGADGLLEDPPPAPPTFGVARAAGGQPPPRTERAGLRVAWHRGCQRRAVAGVLRRRLREGLQPPPGKPGRPPPSCTCSRLERGDEAGAAAAVVHPRAVVEAARCGLRPCSGALPTEAGGARCGRVRPGGPAGPGLCRRTLRLVVTAGAGAVGRPADKAESSRSPRAADAPRGGAGEHAGVRLTEAGVRAGGRSTGRGRRRAQSGPPGRSLSPPPGLLGAPLTAESRLSPSAEPPQPKAEIRASPARRSVRPRWRLAEGPSCRVQRPLLRAGENEVLSPPLPRKVANPVGTVLPPDVMDTKSPPRSQPSNGVALGLETPHRILEGTRPFRPRHGRGAERDRSPTSSPESPGRRRLTAGGGRPCMSRGRVVGLSLQPRMLGAKRSAERDPRPRPRVTRRRPGSEATVPRGGRGGARRVVRPQGHAGFSAPDASCGHRDTRASPHRTRHAATGTRGLLRTGRVVRPQGHAGFSAPDASCGHTDTRASPHRTRRAATGTRGLLRTARKVPPTTAAQALEAAPSSPSSRSGPGDSRVSRCPSGAAAAGHGAGASGARPTSSPLRADGSAAAPGDVPEDALCVAGAAVAGRDARREGRSDRRSPSASAEGPALGPACPGPGTPGPLVRGREGRPSSAVEQKHPPGGTAATPGHAATPGGRTASEQPRPRGRSPGRPAGRNVTRTTTVQSQKQQDVQAGHDLRRHRRRGPRAPGTEPDSSPQLCSRIFRVQSRSLPEARYLPRRVLLLDELGGSTGSERGFSLTPAKTRASSRGISQGAAFSGKQTQYTAPQVFQNEAKASGDAPAPGRDVLGNRRQEHGTESVTEEPAAGVDAHTGWRRTLWWPHMGRKLFLCELLSR
ncbi:collagen alpha-1(I) chain-like [Lutra lutra]|uniref:collagen alpha-1(I) chain-like n=1 Tax=Lutra lutra TaxID=9657 RepID=UPI001FD1ED6F|nr:collagen alpha-1(I) chain-like [Lutra lutra]